MTCVCETTGVLKPVCEMATIDKRNRPAVVVEAHCPQCGARYLPEVRPQESAWIRAIWNLPQPEPRLF